jgi:hypothetical protein
MTSWYWIVACDNTVENPLVVSEASLQGLDESDFTSGVTIANWDETAWFRSPNADLDGDPDDVLQNHLGLYIYSMRLRNALNAADITGIQYLPVRVFLSDGSQIEGFAIANILCLVPALDLENSDFDVFPDDYFLPERRGKVRGIRKPVLRRAAVEPFDVIRLAEFKWYACVSERFKHVFEKNRLTGYSFHELTLS